MLKRLLSTLSLLFCFLAPITAQQIESTLNVYAERFAPEKLHLHFDRNTYTRDETIHYKAYLLQDQDLSILSKNLYVDFYDANGKLLLQTSAPLVQSSANGSFTIPANYSDNVLYIKSYTTWMLNFDTAFIYKRTIRIYQPPGEKTAKNKVVEKPVAAAMIKLYPEGGFAVEGLANRIAFEAVNQFGKPLSIHGRIKTNNGKVLDSVTSMHDGMGIFSLLPEKGLSYFFEWNDDHSNTGVLPILIEKKSGANLSIEQNNKKAFLTLQRTADAGTLYKTVHLLVHRNERLLYKFDINMSEKTSINFDIPTKDLHSGIVQFTLFNNDWIPVAERIIFANNKNHFFQPQLNVVKKDLGKKGKNELEVVVPDTLLANMSIAVIDASLVANTYEPTIFSDFLLTDEIKGKVNNPGYYFQTSSQDSETIASHLDLVMLTHGHRRIDWEKIVKGELPVITYPAETDYIGIKGKLNNKKLQRSKNQLLNVMLLGKDSIKAVHIIPVQEGGVFEKKNVFYYDTVKLFYGVNGKTTFAPDEVAEFQNGLLSTNEKNKLFTGSDFTKETPDSIYGALAHNFFDVQGMLKSTAGFETLKEVVVNSRVKTKIQQLDNFYAKGFFAGDGNNYKVDVEGDIVARGYANLFDYLQSKLPGLTVTHIGTSVNVTWFRSFELVGAENGPSYFLDEIPVSLDAILDMPMANVAYVKGFRPPFVGAFLNGVNGAIAVYTKKGYNPVYQDTSGVSLARTILQGYTKFKEFTQPDYDNSKSPNESDYRATLYWNPYVLTDKSNPRFTIPFYNNDFSKKLLIVLEGFDMDGKLTRVEKVIEQ